MLCRVPQSLSAWAEAACAQLCAGSQGRHGWNSLPWNPPWLGSALPRRMSGKSPDSATEWFGSFCSSFSLKEHLASPWLTSNVRQRVREADGSRLRRDGIFGWSVGWVTGPSAGAGLGQHPGSSAGNSSPAGSAYGFLPPSQQTSLLLNYPCKRLRILY